MTRKNQVDLRTLKQAVDRILDHMIDDLGVTKVVLEHDLYWTINSSEALDLSRDPGALEVGNLWDDWEFVSHIPGGEGVPIVYQLTEIAPLLAYIGKTFEQFGDRDRAGADPGN